MDRRPVFSPQIRGVMSHARMFAARIAAIALPNCCALCGNMSHSAICAACDAAYWNEPRLRCTVCAAPLNPGHAHSRRAGRSGVYRCDVCRTTQPPFDATLTLADYRAPLDGLARALKFRARLALGAEFARRLARRIDDEHDAVGDIDVLAPIPLAHGRLASRGYNQAWAIARPLARRLGVSAMPTLLVRVAETAPQSRLDRQARRDNVASAFAVAHDVAGFHVVLVDDVMTSGATLSAAAQALKAAGAARVTNVVALRTARD